MKKFALLIVLCIVGVIGSVAQNVVRVINGDSVREFLMENIDSLTIDPTFKYLEKSGLSFYYPKSAEFNGSLLLRLKTDGSAVIENVCPLFTKSDLTASRGCNVLRGTAARVADGYTIVCPPNQSMNYEDVVFIGYNEETEEFEVGKEIVFHLSADFKTLSSPGFATYSANMGGWYSSYTNYVCTSNNPYTTKKRSQKKSLPLTIDNPKPISAPVTKADKPLQLKSAEKVVAPEK